MISESIFPETLAVRVMIGARQDWLRWKVPADAEGAVIGWIQQRPHADAGVPPKVAHLLARALTQCFRITFLDFDNGASPGWSEHEDRSVARLAAPGWRGIFSSNDLYMTSTRSALHAEHLFDAEAGGWSREAQFVLLSSPLEPLPKLDSPALHELTRGRLEAGSSILPELWGIMVPGPDGDLAQVLLFHKRALHDFLDQLEEATQASGIRFEIVTSEEFNQTNWFAEDPERQKWP